MRFLIALAFVCLPAFADDSETSSSLYLEFAASHCAGLTEARCIRKFRKAVNAAPEAKALPAPVPIPQTTTESDYGLPPDYRAFAADNCAGLTETNCLAKYQDQKTAQSQPQPTPQPPVQYRERLPQWLKWMRAFTPPPQAPKKKIHCTTQQFNATTETDCE